MMRPTTTTTTMTPPPAPTTMSTTHRLGALAATALAACGGTTGTIQLDLTTAPGSGVLDAVQTLRVTLTRPRQVVEAERTASGFALALEVDAAEESGSLIVEGLDASGALVASGQSPAFLVGAINADIVVYMAPPLSIASAPVTLGAPRSEVSGAPLIYGAVLAGGRDDGGAPSTAIAVYNAYNHRLDAGAPLLAARTGLAVGTTPAGGVYLFGGTGPDGNPTGTLWRFDTTAPPRGLYTSLGEMTALARTDQRFVTLGPEQFLITGAPPLSLDRGVLTARDDLDALPTAGASVTPTGGTAIAIFAGDELVRFRDGAFDTLDAAGRTDAAATALPDGRIVVLGGGGATPSRDALAIDPVTGSVAVIADALATPRARPALAATTRHLIVAGGTDPLGSPIATAEVLDAATLAPIAILPIAARAATLAIALPNDQVMIVGGTPASSQIELFTPGPP